MEKEMDMGKNINRYFSLSNNNYSYYSYSSERNKIKIFSGVYLNGERKEGKEFNYDGNLIYLIY